MLTRWKKYGKSPHWKERADLLILGTVVYSLDISSDFSVPNYAFEVCVPKVLLPSVRFHLI